MTRNSSHCFWNTVTLARASSNSPDIVCTFSLVSSILNKPFFSLLAASLSSLRFSYNSLTENKTNYAQINVLWQHYAQSSLTLLTKPYMRLWQFTFYSQCEWPQHERFLLLTFFLTYLLIYLPTYKRPHFVYDKLQTHSLHLSTCTEDIFLFKVLVHTAH